jgi:hypothetical protein
MAEVGLISLAKLGLEIAQSVLPPHRSRFSKRQFTQPQLLAVLCVMRYEDWTYREAEVRLREHGELRRALQLSRVPDHTTLYRFLRRLQEDRITAALNAVVGRLPRGRVRRRAKVAVDATGLAPSATSTYFVHRVGQTREKPTRRHWLKWLVAVDIERQVVLGQMAHAGPWNDCARLPAVVEAARQNAPIGLVLADAEFDSERNHLYVRQVIKAQSVIPAKRGKKTWRIHGVRAQMRKAFPQKQYCRRSLVESVFSSVKRKLSARAPGRTLCMQRRQALLLGLAYNLYRL